MTKERNNRPVTIRVWDGEAVRSVFTVGPTGGSWIGAVGGAGNSTRPDIELDPWAGLIVDHRAEYPHPVDITREQEMDEPEEDEDPDE